MKCIIGTLLAVNVYLSHWGPWRWPSNYYILLFSVIFYYVASTIYAKLSPVDNTEGNLVLFILFRLANTITKGVERYLLWTSESPKWTMYCRSLRVARGQVSAKKHSFTTNILQKKGFFLSTSIRNICLPF